MKAKNKNILCTLFTMSCVLMGYFFLFPLRTTEVVAVHEDGEFSSVLVKNFPFTDRGKIDWWIKKNLELKEKYNIPKPDSDGFSSIVFWDFGDGYKEEGKYDRRCFTDMKPPINCIDKKSLMIVRNFNKKITFISLDSGTYRIYKKGKIVKNKSE